jgi:acyl-CoA thioester hydrolase
MMFFAENGFAIEAFSRLRVGPVVMKDEIEYHREIALLEPIRVTLALAGLAEDGSRFRLRNCFYLTGEALSARVTSDGGWMDLERRRLVAPPAALLTVLRILPRTDDFEVLATSLR